jgi:hypothetical protein
MLGRTCLALLVVFTAGTAAARTPTSTCGSDPTKVKDCDHADYGSCGNACCVVESEGTSSVEDVYATVKQYLLKGGDDGSYSYSTGADAAGHNPTDDLTPFNISWSYVFQGNHKTAGGYVDTLNFNVKATDDGGHLLRLFSVSDIHGALGDHGQNYKTLAYLLDGRPLTVVHGCGKGVVPPALDAAE